MTAHGVTRTRFVRVMPRGAVSQELIDPHGRALLAAVAVMMSLLAACSSSAKPATSNVSTTRTTATAVATAPQHHAVGLTTMTFVDRSRPTQANGSAPSRPGRALTTTVLYPAAGNAGSSASQPGMTPDRSSAPYPLVVFAHGLGASPDLYLPLLREWAGAGYVVAAPRFPLTNDQTPGGPNAGDVINQPADMTFVVTSVLNTSRASTGPLAGLVDPDKVAAAGHSNGAITALGLAANTCCRDPRLKAAIIMAGTNENYPGGRYDFAHAPPLLMVHGTDDALVPYSEGVKVFNLARGPKALLSVAHGDHGSAAAFTGPTAVVIRTTIDFLDIYLRGDTRAAQRIVDDARSTTTSLRYIPAAGSTVTIPTVPAPKADLHASATPNANLRGGQKVTITWSGYTAGKVINILECSAADKDLANQAACDFSRAALLHPDPTGSGTLQLEIVEGKVGTGTCDATHQGCFIIVNNASSTDPAASPMIPITFAR